MAELLFYVLSVLAVASGVGVVAARSPMVSVLSLLGTFLCLAGIYLLAGFQFLAAAQLLVYAGAIMVLFLFVVMLLNLDQEERNPERPGAFLGPRRLAIAGGVAAGLVLVGTMTVGFSGGSPMDPALAATGIDDLEAIAALLFSRYMLPFEAASLLLLATMVGVIVLAKRDRARRDTASAPADYPYRVPEAPGTPNAPQAPLPTSPESASEREEVLA